ncbi:hypothetical protein IEO21_04393 [Rhodonia placenta]|uniref:Uncharacterized protein n=1 Tax=Rhodonia placenta TaxID=104341 RepID=A0A8H7U3A2_9APHY|nr:hypothetical protein IEO21_04393 [Postia placenta]
MTATKKNGLATVFVHSAPVPLDEDTDSDFNPGKIALDAPKRGRKRRSPSMRHSSPPHRKTNRRKVITRDYEKKDDLGLESASENEDEADNEEEPDDETESDKEVQEDDLEPMELQTLNSVMKPTAYNPQSRASQRDKDTTHSVAESETETETDAEIASSSNPSSKRKSPDHVDECGAPPKKKVRAEYSQDESVTESESDVDPVSTHTTRTAPQHLQPSLNKPDQTSFDSGSETESDSEAEELANKFLQPRPTFPLKPDQPSLGPLILDDSHKVPGRINTFLREYQRDGIRFFWERYKDGRGGVLGDDMGLKSGNVNDLNRRRKHVSQLQDRPEWQNDRILPPANQTWPTCLIIAPSSVVGNWEREFEAWGYFEVGMYTGPPKERAGVLNDFKMGRLDVVLTSFETARKDISLLDDLAWTCVIVDEVHRVKNPRAAVAMAFNQFSCTVRFGLTGTAIQNSFAEFWTILDWTNPGSVGTKRQWDGYVSRPLTIGQSKSAAHEQRTKAILVAQILKEKLLPKFFLRRTKDIIKNQLPGKDDQVVFCPLTPKQTEVYKRILAIESVQNMIRKDDQFADRVAVAKHTPIAPSDSPEQTARNRELSRVAFGSETIPKYGPAMLVPRFCGKWMVLESLLADWSKDTSNKVLIFTKSVKLLEMLEFHLRSRNLGFVKLDGSTKAQDRMPLIDKFHDDPDVFVFLISTMAGGTGLNLTGANKVVIFDPAHDLQAIDRAYRFGQTRDVSVFRLLGAGSIEELIYARQVYKQQQMQVGYNASFQTRYFEGVQGEKTKQGELFGIKNIFTLHEDTLATKQAVERAILSDFNWALANMDAKKRRSDGKATRESEVAHKDSDNMNGLDSLLFDDSIPKVEHKVNDIQKVLNDIGVRYTHRNEDLIAESAIEGQKFQTTMEVTKREKKERKRKMAQDDQAAKQPVEPWPPVRRRHQPKLTAEERLKARQTSMVELGHIAGPQQLHSFLESKFMKWTIEKQQQFMAELDAHHATRNRTKPT